MARNTTLKELCTYMQNIQDLNPTKLISILQTTLDLLTVVKGSTDYFEPEHYATLAVQCPQLLGIGTTMHLCYFFQG